jgi:hypothetical protein
VSASVYGEPAGPMPLLVMLPLRTKNPLNTGFGTFSQVARIVATKRRKEEREVSKLALVAALRRRGLFPSAFIPCLVTLTRVSIGTLDDDGLAASCKGIRDGIADALELDDGDRSRLCFRYAQRKGKRGVFAVEVLLERAAP